MFPLLGPSLHAVALRTRRRCAVPSVPLIPSSTTLYQSTNQSLIVCSIVGHDLHSLSTIEAGHRSPSRLPNVNFNANVEAK